MSPRGAHPTHSGETESPVLPRGLLEAASFAALSVTGSGSFSLMACTCSGGSPGLGRGLPRRPRNPPELAVAGDVAPEEAHVRSERLEGPADDEGARASMAAPHSSLPRP